MEARHEYDPEKGEILHIRDKKVNGPPAINNTK